MADLKAVDEKASAAGSAARSAARSAAGSAARSAVVALLAAYNDAETRRLQRQANDTIGRPVATVHQLTRKGAS